jgi:AAA domain (dynein-related subfamily)
MRSIEASIKASLQAETLPEVVRVSGVPITKGKGGDLCPPLSQFEGLVFTETHNELLRVMAVGVALNQPVLIEGGSGLGKTTMARYLAAVTNNESFLINCREMPAETIIGKMGAVEGTKSGFGFIDGLLLQAIRNGGIVLFDEYNKLHGDTRSAVQPVIDAIIRGEEYVTIAENHGERVKIHEDFRIIATQNEPNGDHAQREPLDKPDFTRWSYHKFPDDLSSKEKLEIALAAPETLKQLPSFSELMERFVEFHDSVSKLSIGKSQAQPVYYAFVRDLERLNTYISKFYQGDLNTTAKEALTHYFGRRYLKDTDNAQVMELIELVKVTVQPVKSSRISLSSKSPDSSSTPVVTGTSKELKEMLAEMRKAGQFIGPNEIKKILAVKDLGSAPALPKDLEKILLEPSPITKGKLVKDDHVLFLLPKSFDGKANTVMVTKELVELAEARRKETKPDAKPVFYQDQDWYFKEKWANKAVTKSKWVLAPAYIPESKDIAKDKGTRSKDFPTQSRIITDCYPEYSRGEAHELITLLSFGELLTGERRYPSGTWGWTETETDKAGADPGRRVDVGAFGADGFKVVAALPGFSGASLGAFLRRNF